MIERRRLLATGLALATPSATPLTALSAEAWREDARILRRAYETLHPGLYRYSTPDQMHRRFERLEAELAAAQDQAGAFLALTRLTASVRCGHSFPNPLNQPDATAAALFGARDRLPFTFRWIDGEMVITGSADARADARNTGAVGRWRSSRRHSGPADAAGSGRRWQ